jgi:hypothetical protein
MLQTFTGLAPKALAKPSFRAPLDEPDRRHIFPILATASTHSLGLEIEQNHARSCAIGDSIAHDPPASFHPAWLDPKCDLVAPLLPSLFFWEPLVPRGRKAEAGVADPDCPDNAAFTGGFVSDSVIVTYHDELDYLGHGAVVSSRSYVPAEASRYREMRSPVSKLSSVQPRTGIAARNQTGHDLVEQHQLPSVVQIH